MRWLALIGMALAGTLVVEPHVAPGRDVRTAGTMQSGVDAHVAGDDAQAIAHHMATLPVSVAYHEFPSAHEIRPSELAATVAWLESLSTTPMAF